MCIGGKTGLHGQKDGCNIAPHMNHAETHHNIPPSDMHNTTTDDHLTPSQGRDTSNEYDKK